MTCQDVDECEPAAPPCHAEATCTNKEGSYTCKCNDGWRGDGSVCVDVDECQSGSASCSKNADCTDTSGSYECQCKDGWEGDGFECEDVDECATGTHDCHTVAVCANTNGGFTCTCQKGYNGDGKTCSKESCPALTAPSNGVKMGNGYLFGDRVIFDCNRGFRLHGSKERLCQSNRQWSGQQARCEGENL